MNETHQWKPGEIVPQSGIYACDTQAHPDAG